MPNVHSETQLSAEYWRGYAAALRDFPNGVGELPPPPAEVIADLEARIEAGPPLPGQRPALRLVKENR